MNDEIPAELRRQALTRVCPNCNAQPGERCTQPTSTGRREVRMLHIGRMSAEQPNDLTEPRDEQVERVTAVIEDARRGWQRRGSGSSQELARAALKAAAITPPAPVDREKLAAMAEAWLNSPTATVEGGRGAVRQLLAVLAVSPAPARDECPARRVDRYNQPERCVLSEHKGPHAWQREPLPVTEEERDV